MLQVPRRMLVKLQPHGGVGRDVFRKTLQKPQGRAAAERLKVFDLQAVQPDLAWQGFR